MPVYEYQAKRESGEEVKGTVEAPSRPAALVQLRQQRLWISQLRDVAAPTASATRDQPLWAKSPWHAFWPIASYGYTSFFRQLGQLIGAGVGMHEALTSLRERVGSGRLQRVLREVTPAISAGGNLADQFTRYPQLFPPHIIGMIRAGEASGNLPEVGEEIARAYELETLTWTGMLIPKLLYGFMILLAAFVVSMPEMLAHGDNLKQCLGWWTANALPVIVKWVVIVFVAYQFLRTVLNFRQIRAFKDIIIYYIPGVNVFLRNAAASRFVWCLKILISAGVQFPQALDTAASATGNAVMAKQLQRAAEKMRRGVPGAEALAGCRALPEDMRGQLATAEQSGRYDDTLNGLSETANFRRKTWMSRLRMLTYALLVVTVVVIVGAAIIMGWKHYYEIIIQKFSAEEPGS